MSTPTTLSLPLLDRVQTASPCDVRWEEMTGDERTRLCAQCNLHVHNIAQMTRSEAEAFLASRFDGDGQPIGHRVCALIYRRADGTIITADCPVGVAALRAKARRALYRVAAVLGLTAVTAAAAAVVENQQAAPMSPSQPFTTLARLVGKTFQYRRMSAGGIIIAPLPKSKP